MRRDPSRSSRFELVDGPLPPASDAASPRPSPVQPSAVLVVAVAVLLVVVAATVLPHRTTDETDLPPPVPSLTPTPSCDLDNPGCQVVLAARWRAEMAAVLRDRLDPGDLYFSGYSYSMSPLYTTGPRLQALGLDVYRLQGGGTEVFIQISQTRADAVRCGVITRHRCVGQRFMDGNRFTLTTTTTVADGIEVQHIPTGTYVITLVARNTTRGTPLDLSTGDLIAVAQDPRLRPPP